MSPNDPIAQRRRPRDAPIATTTARRRSLHQIGVSQRFHNSLKRMIRVLNAHGITKASSYLNYQTFVNLTIALSPLAPGRHLTKTRSQFAVRLVAAQRNASRW